MFKKLFLILNITFIFLINLVLGIAFFFTQKIYVQEKQRNILQQAKIIEELLSLKNENQFFPLSKLITNQQWFILNIIKYPYSKFKSKRIIQNNYLIYQTYYHWYVIIIWKNISELKNIKVAFLKAWLIVNLIWIIISFILAFLISKNTLKTIDYLTSYFKNYDFRNPKKINFIPKEKELKQLIIQINKFVDIYQKILKTQKEFIQDVSHQLKTPLMQIYSTLEIIENSLDPKLQPKIEQIKNSLENLKQIIQDLNFVFNENHFNEKKEINLKEIIEKTTSKYDPIIRQKKLKILLDTKDIKKKININLFEKLVDNLISNAILYNKENWEIYIKLDKNWITIKDSGIWINNEDIKNIFDRFYRGKDSAKIYPNWSWLWLNIVKKIIDNFWRKISVESKKWIGTKFKIDFNKNLTD